ncbi:unnamed protein product [Paramecium pentaurelia]|uniref:TRAFD1/XAF1 zinc finger domain-containing protein n=1 Tax=Paramecium pentaurelia TaxID=43138 RepID=A0A8S1V6R4_9CILI|nr:unnamed protein product [Paramecium pentaurelia]
MNEITIPCSNCKQPIAESKHMLHETYCLRNNIKCLKCGVFYDKNDPESHEEEYHKKEKCQYCLLEFEDLKKHKCYKKPKQCMHCDLSFPADQLFQHENQCGSRTEKCDICNSYIIMREYSSHVKECKPKPKVESSQVQKKPSNQEIYDRPNYDMSKIDDRIDQQKFNSKKETPQQNASSQIQSKQQVQQQQQQQQQTKPIGSGYKFGQAAGEQKSKYQLTDEDKQRQKDGIRPPSSNNQTGQRPQQQNITSGTQSKQQSYNQKQQNSQKKEETTQFDNQYERQQYINKQSQQSQPQTQQQQKQPTQAQKSLESYKNSQNDKQQFQTQNNNPILRRPDTAIAREIQKQIELEEEFGISSEEYLQQQMFNQMLLDEKKEKAQPIQKTPIPQSVIPARVPQKVDNQEFNFEGISEEEKLVQLQLMESFKDYKKKR